jgi:hypothetical protein
VLLLSPWLLNKPPPELPAFLPAIEFETTAIALSAEQRAAIWKLHPLVRGKVIDKLFRQGNLHELSRTIDDFVDSIATSNKSVDLDAATYQDFSRLLSRLNQNLEKLEAYSGTDWGGDSIKATDMASKESPRVTRRLVHIRDLTYRRWSSSMPASRAGGRSRAAHCLGASRKRTE